MRKIAVSDIHGCSKTFHALLFDQIKLTQEDELYLLGDYVDRGPDSKGVLDMILKLKEDEYQLHCLMGNHELMMLNAWKDYEDMSVWLMNGGETTMNSFGVEDVEDVDEKYIDLLSSFSYYLEVENYILVHAGLNFGTQSNVHDPKFLWKVLQPFKDRKSMLWIRDWYEDIDLDWLRGRVILHGHTPLRETDIRMMQMGWSELPVLDIDNGCFATFQPGMGQLCAFDMTYKQLYFQRNIE